ncbi:uncharacterized protein sS8_4487 [Methylocaldum marinum]|uniref:Uncharacterized protein n=1 Tax=Methylocaldum marinum TaxID=1432792 RepID=A0A250KXR4_9GAMM|nr:hypothetical protein [Methylocaldum marinum]BBA36417.1 uncharacterized protein sS8_4487 [Methylocaldum marinum]
MTNRTFSEAFAANMEALGLPVPQSLFGTLNTTLATVGAIAGGITMVGASATVSEIFLTVPVGLGTAATAAAVTEIVAVVGACAASFYLGACIGSVLIAAYETLDLRDLAKVANWMGDLAADLKKDVSDFLREVHGKHPQLSPTRKSHVLALRMKGAPNFSVA